MLLKSKSKFHSLTLYPPVVSHLLKAPSLAELTKPCGSCRLLCTHLLSNSSVYCKSRHTWLSWFFTLGFKRPKSRCQQGGFLSGGSGDKFLPNLFRVWQNSVPHDCKSEAVISLLTADWSWFSASTSCQILWLMATFLHLQPTVAG